MKFFIAVTDNQWHRFLAERHPDELNFWRPGAGAFRVLDEGEPLLFKLHSPNDYIVGGGFFVRYSVLPLSLAWEAFEQKNGAPDFSTFYQQIAKYRERRGTMKPDPHIGCIILTDPFFFEADDWIPVPRNWSSNIVQGKTYDTEEPIGADVWDRVQERLARYRTPYDYLAESRERYGAEYLTRSRLGQGTFRVLVTEAYQRRCAVTGQRTLPVLQAAHIKPYAESGPNRVDNGLLLRADLHLLLDKGYMTLTEDLEVEVSRRIKEDFENGKEYYAMHGQHLKVIPPREVERPSRDFIQWHNEHRFLG
ncbi:MAG: HNH endonuclease [Anaerolineae bacterium]